MAQQDNTGTFDAIVVGAGFGGLYALHKLRGAGLTVRVFEAGSDVGGTWFWNRYPGARCDVDSVAYSYSFDENLQQEWNWPERFSTQADILAYQNHVAERFDLRKDIRFNTRVTSATFDEGTGTWTVGTDDGKTYKSKFCVMATGNLSLPRVPDFKGLESFKGRWFHTGQWPHEPVDFTGRRVGVIGTGSSGIQAIPIIAEQASQLYVFQRTANFSLAAQNHALDEEMRKKQKAGYSQLREEAQGTPFGIGGHPPPTKSALDDTPEAREAMYEKNWKMGGSVRFLYSYTDLLTNKAANDTAADFVRKKIRETVKDPKTAELLCPNTHPIGAKRLCLDTNYYQTYNLPHVKLVDVRANPIVEITPKGVKTTDADYEVDDIVFATGYDAITGALRDIDIRGRDGLALKEKWSHGPRTYLGLMTVGFPNFFILTGPGSPSVKSNMVVANEQHVNLVLAHIENLRKTGNDIVEPVPQAEDEWVEHVNQVANSTLYPTAESWYLGSNIPGKPRVFMPYVGGFHKYREKCEQIVAEGFRGFKTSRAQETAKN
ncbi:flavin-containing monooxygenase [Ramlibacter sp.]|uniref:flavin-containing monooxygenase n=1 Tax=Ramlibacter sp. TaxID=1917967 RepID=UPI003D0A2C44